MARKKVKDSEARSFRIRKDIGERLDAYSEESRIPRTAIVEMAIEKYLDDIDTNRSVPNIKVTKGEKQTEK